MGIVVSSPWIGLSLLGLVYVCLIPFSWFTFRRHARQDAATSGAVVPLRAVDPGAARD
jgi:CDP-diacylglycerol--serine O-phosphatidyltransferase